MKRTVIIVEDSRFQAMLLRHFFEEVMDFEVAATGSNGMQAVELYRTFRPDLICLDLTMPVKDGQTALSEILMEYPDANAFIISAVGGSSILQCMKMGAKGYLEKPFRLEDEDLKRELSKTLLEIFGK